VDLGIRPEATTGLLDIGADALGDLASVGHERGVGDDDARGGAPQRPLSGVGSDRQPLQQGHHEPPDVAEPELLELLLLPRLVVLDELESSLLLEVVPLLVVVLVLDEAVVLWAAWAIAAIPAVPPTLRTTIVPVATASRRLP
jgi:hypothetical protein